MLQNTSAVFQRTFTYSAVRLINCRSPTIKNNLSETKLKQDIYNNKISGRDFGISALDNLGLVF
nr:unnamed protein product [Callosobruchus chinensis]